MGKQTVATETKLTAVPQPEPAEVGALRELGRLVREFGKDAATRSTVTDADLATMQLIRRAQDNVSRAAIRGRSADSVDGVDLEEINATLNDWLQIQSKTQTATIAGIQVSELAISHGGFRTHLASYGATICDTIESLIADRIAAAARRAQEKQGTAAALDQLRKVPYAGEAIDLYRRLASAALAGDDAEASECASAADALYRALGRILTIPSVAATIPAGVQAWVVLDFIMQQCRDAAATKAA